MNSEGILSGGRVPALVRHRDIWFRMGEKCAVLTKELRVSPDDRCSADYIRISEVPVL